MRTKILLAGTVVVGLGAATLVLSWPILLATARGMIEARLEAETGLTWRIARIDVALPGTLVLGDVTAEGGGVSGRVRQVSVTGPIGLVFGGAGTASVKVEDAALTVATRAEPGRRGQAGLGGGAPAQASGGPSLDAVRARLDAVSGRMIDDGRTVALAIGSADLDLDLGADPSQRDPGIQIGLPEHELTLTIEAARRGAARAITFAATPAGGPRIAGTASARTEGGGVRLDRISGTIDRAPFTGSFGISTAGARPQVALDLRLEALALTDPATGARTPPVAGLSVPVRADLVPVPAWFSGYDAQASVSIQRLGLGAIRSTAVNLAAWVDNGRLEATLENATLYGGTAHGRYWLESDPRNGRHQIELSLADVQTRPLMQDAVNIASLDGRGNATLAIQARGTTPAALLRSASGQCDVSIGNGTIDGLDLARATGLTSFGGGLATRLDRLGGRFTMADGRATTANLQLKTGLIEAEGAGTIDFPARTLDLRLKPLKVTAGGRLNVPIQISGSWDDPAVSADVAGLAQDPAGTLQGLRNLGESILGGDAGARGGSRDDGGGNLGRLFDSFMPRQQGLPPQRRRP